MTVAGRNHLAVLRLLLARGVAVDMVHPAASFTAFHSACVKDMADCAEALLRAGCDAGIKTKDGKTGLVLAELERNTALVRRLESVAAATPLIGAVGEVCGLTGAPEHNGQRAAVRRHLTEKGRFELELLESGQTMDVKPANFELVVVPAGLTVQVQGMVGAAEHNEKEGVVESRVGIGLGRIVVL
jgi:hypothetical protein